MRKTLALLLASSALLSACGTTDESGTAEEIVEESSAENTEEAEQQEDEPTEEDVADTGDEIEYDEVDDGYYFSIYYQQGDVEIDNKLEDASDIAGLHRIEFPDEHDRTLPQETFMDIQEDGRATMLTYALAEGVGEADTYSGQDLQFMYIDEQNELKPVEAPIPYNVEMASGYMVREYSEIQFKIAEYANVVPHHDENGQIAISALVNPPGYLITLGGTPTLYEELGDDVTAGPSPLDLPFETATLSEMNLSDVHLPFLVHSEGLKSVGQTEHMLSVEHIERSLERAENDAFDNNVLFIPLVKNDNELMHYLGQHENRFARYNFELADNPADYIGYTQDNTEINPGVVFVNPSGIARTFDDNGMIMDYNNENGTWDPAPY